MTARTETLAGVPARTRRCRSIAGYSARAPFAFSRPEASCESARPSSYASGSLLTRCGGRRRRAELVRQAPPTLDDTEQRCMTRSLRLAVRKRDLAPPGRSSLVRAAGALRTVTPAPALERKRARGALLPAQRGALARSGQDSCRGAKAGVRIHDPKLFLCIRLVRSPTGQPSLLLRVRRESEPGSVDVLACRAKWKPSRPEPQIGCRPIYLASAPSSPRSSRVRRKPSERLAPSRS
jgi:hypothetical protein